MNCRNVSYLRVIPVKTGIYEFILLDNSNFSKMNFAIFL